MKIDLKAITINKCWQGRRYKTPEYKNWRKQASLLMRKDQKLQEKRHYELSIRVYTTHEATSDADNFIKPIQDALVDAEIIPDDRFIKRVTCEKFKSKENYFEYEIFIL